jgi:hypothetical protein
VLDPVTGWLAGVHWLPFGFVVDGLDRFAGWAPLWAQLLAGLVVGVVAGAVAADEAEGDGRSG